MVEIYAQELGLFLTAIAQGGKTRNILNEVKIAPSHAKSSELRVVLDVQHGEPIIRLLQECEVASGVMLVAVKSRARSVKLSHAWNIKHIFKSEKLFYFYPHGS